MGPIWFREARRVTPSHLPTIATADTFRSLTGVLALARPRQWIKNAFVLAPLIFSGGFLDPSLVAEAMLAVGLFCVGASAVYVVNDLNDLERDRQHPLKARTRPLAAGYVSVPAAMVMLGLLYGLLAIGWWARPEVAFVVLAYVVLNAAYSFALKHQPVIDIFVIAIGFVLRVYAGAQALSVPVSGWMFVTTLCLALYLAAIKRGQELKSHGINGREVLSCYSAPLLARYAEMSATGALLFYSMFVMSSKPQLLLTVPVVLFGLFRDLVTWSKRSAVVSRRPTRCSLTGSCS